MSPAGELLGASRSETEFFARISLRTSSIWLGGDHQQAVYAREMLARGAETVQEAGAMRDALRFPHNGK